MWAAFDATYYVGGRSTIQGVDNDDRQSNTRLGGTLALPVGRRHSVKLAVSIGAITATVPTSRTGLRGVADGLIPRPTPAR